MNAHAESPEGFDQLTDQELLRRLRAGERLAYATLWSRYIGLALHVAHQCAPGRAEDLASEAFLAVFDQVTAKGSGPQEAFWPYLKRVMLNLAGKWAREGKIIDVLPDVDSVESEDPLSVLSEQSSSAELLAAFEALPARWQRALWLAEVEQVPRQSIAQDLGIKPNAVSALMRRARRGLRLEWLSLLIPHRLRGDSSHHADQLPAYIAEKHTMLPEARAALESHVPSCSVCSSLYADLRAQFRRTRRTTLGATGFAALAAVLPTWTTGGATIGGTAAAVATVGAGAGAGVGFAGIGAATVAALAIGTLAVVGITAPPPGLAPSLEAGDGRAASSTTRSGASENSSTRSSAHPTTGTDTDTTADTDADADTDSRTRNNSDKPRNVATATDVELSRDNFPDVREIPPPPIVISTPDDGTSWEPGRKNPNPAIPDVELSDPTENFQKPRKPLPTPVPPTHTRKPLPQTTPPAPTPEPEPDRVQAAPLTAVVNPLSAPAQSYLAPTLQGTSTLGVEVRVNVFDPDDPNFPEGIEYIADSQPDGTWEFDLRPLDLPAGTYFYTVWGIHEGAVSTPVQGNFELLRPQVGGIAHPDPIGLAEASRTGIVIEFIGPPGGTVCIVVANGSAQYAEVVLDGTGRSLQRLKLRQSGAHFFIAAHCADGYAGPAETWVIPVEDTGGPDALWGPGASTEGEVFGLFDL